MTDLDFKSEITTLLSIKQKKDSLREASAAIRRDECTAANEQIAALKALADKLKRLLTQADFDELYQHLPNSSRESGV